MEITVIASGSTGNAYRISDGQTAVLLDAGIPLKVIQRALNFRVRDLSGCLITHAHSFIKRTYAAGSYPMTVLSEKSSTENTLDVRMQHAAAFNDAKIIYVLNGGEDTSGNKKETALMGIFKDWGIPVEKYEGPDVSHAKTTFKNEYLSDIALELLETAHKHGGADCIIRARKGKVSVVPKGSNSTIYCFEEERNLELTKYKISTGDMVTVVKVVASEDDDGRQAVEAIINGKTEYGKRQKIYVRDDDDSLATATAAAKKILKEEGEPEETMNFKAPDIPWLRKGDKVKVTARVFTGYALVVSIQHNASNKSMSMGLVKYNADAIKGSGAAQSTTTKKDYKVGDIVNFNGGNHYYTSQDASPRGGNRTGGKAKITVVAKGAKHPYHLIGGAYNNVGGSSNVYGWVDAGSFS